MLHDINEFAERRSSRGGVARFLTNRSDASEIAEYREKLNQAKGNFSVRFKSLVQLFEEVQQYIPLNTGEIPYIHPHLSTP